MIGLLIGILFTPYVISKLGVEAYGVYPLAMSLFVWAVWISLGVNWSVGRYVTIAYTKCDYMEAATIFNTSMVASIVFGTVLVIIGILSSPFVGFVLRLPSGTENAARTLIILGSIATALGVISGVSSVAFFCLNRFDIRAFLFIMRSMLSVGTAFALFQIARPRLEWIGLGLCVGAMAEAVTAFFWGQKLIPCLSFKPRLFELKSLKTMMGTNIWVVIDQLGTILMISVNLLLCNRLFGPGVSAEYALASQWENILRSIMASINVFTPQYVKLFAQGNIPGLRELGIHAARFISVCIGICGGLIVGFSPWLPSLWLHRATDMVGPMMAGLAAIIIMNAAANPLYGIWQAFNRVKVPSIATLLSGLISIVMTVFLAQYTDLGPWSMIIGPGIAFSLRNVMFSYRYIHYLVSAPYRYLAGASFIGIMASTGIAVSVNQLASWKRPENWLNVAAIGIISIVIITPIIYAILLTRSERNAMHKILGMIRGRNRKHAVN